MLVSPVWGRHKDEKPALPPKDQYLSELPRPAG